MSEKKIMMYLGFVDFIRTHTVQFCGCLCKHGLSTVWDYFQSIANNQCKNAFKMDPHYRGSGQVTVESTLSGVCWVDPWCVVSKQVSPQLDRI